MENENTDLNKYSDFSWKILMLYSSLQSKYGVLKRHAEKIEMEMTQMHLWQAQAMEGMDEDFGDGMSVSFSNFLFRGGMDVC